MYAALPRCSTLPRLLVAGKGDSDQSEFDALQEAPERIVGYVLQATQTIGRDKEPGVGATHRI